jgi:hypothetical protein
MKLDSSVWIAWDGDRIGRLVGLATMHDQPEELARLSGAIDRGNRVFESWCVEGGGALVQMGGDEGRATVSAARLDRLEDVRARYQEATGATVSVGVGARLSEAAKALYAAKLRGGDRAVVHSPEVEAEVAASLSAERSEGAKMAEEYGDGLGKAEVEPQTQKPAQASLADELREAAQASGETEGASKARAAKEGDEARERLAGVLRAMQGRARELAALKERAPAVVEALAELLDAVRDAARLLPRTEAAPPPSAPPAPAAEGAPVEKGIGGAEAGRVKLNLPVGTQHDGKVKVRHEDGSVSWVSVRSGMVLAQDPAGHPASARNPSIH